MYSRRRIKIEKNCVFEGAVFAAKDLEIKDTVVMSWDSALYNSPPPGELYDFPLAPIQGTWRNSLDHLVDVEYPAVPE